MNFGNAWPGANFGLIDNTTEVSREPAFVALKQAFGDRYLYAGLGTVLELEATSPVSTAQAVTPAKEK